MACPPIPTREIRPALPAQPNRRSFLATAGLTGVAAALRPRLAHASALVGPLPEELSTIHLLCSSASSLAAEASLAEKVSLAEEASHAERPGTLLSLHPHRSSQTGIPLPAPRTHAHHPTLPIFYVANAVEQRAGLPRGAVSAVRIDRSTGALHLLATEPLALFATRPERLAVSPGGHHLLVPAHGSISLLPLLPDGRPGVVTHAFRLPGRGPNPTQIRSAPFAATFHPTAPLAYVSDQGTDSLLVLSLAADSLSLAHRHRLPAGFEPTHLALSRDATSLFVRSATSAILLHLSLDRATGLPSATMRLHALPGETGGPIHLDPATGVLLATSHHRGLTLLSRVDAVSRAPALGSTTPIPDLSRPSQLALVGRTLLVAGDPHLIALDLDQSPLQPPRNLLSNQTTFGLSAVPLA